MIIYRRAKKVRADKLCNGSVLYYRRCDSVCSIRSSMAFNCTLMAPHGGIFVFPVVSNPLMYLVALVAGTVVSALVLGAIKKPVVEM